jgi:hypothetical protein
LAQLKDSMQQFLFRPSNSSSLSLDSGRVLADLDSFLTLPIRLTKSGQMLLCNAATLFETSTALGSSPLFVRQGALSHTFQSPMKIYNLLAATSAYLDTRFGRGLSTQTSYWRLCCINYQNQLLAHPSTRYGFESVAGIIGSTVMNVVTAEEGFHVHAHALWQLLRYRQNHHMSFTSEVEDIYVFSLRISLSKLRSEWLRVEQYATSSVAQDWMSDHNFCLGVFESLLNWTVSMKYHDRRQHCVPSSLRSLLNKCTMLSDEAFIRSQQLWLLSYLTLVSHEYRGDPGGARRFSDMLGTCCDEVAQSIAQLPDIIYLLYKNSDTNSLTKWQALRLVEVLHCLSNSRLAKVIYLFTRILQVEATMQSGEDPVIEDLIQISDEILRFSPPIYAFLGLQPTEFDNCVDSISYPSEDTAEAPVAMDDWLLNISLGDDIGGR